MENTEKTITSSDAVSNKRKTSFLILFILVAVIGGVWFAYYEAYAKYSEQTDDAYVNGDLVVISPQISGTVIAVLPDQGDYVKKGQVIVTLDSSDTQIALQEAEAKLGIAVRQVRSLYATADNAKAKMESSKVAYRQAVNDYKRRQNIAKSGAISKEDLTHYQDLVDSTNSAYLASQEAFKMTLALVDNTVIENHPAIKWAEAGVRKSYLNNTRTEIVAPVSGYVAKRSVQLGAQVQVSSQLMVIVPLHKVWVDANFKESQMKDMRLGQKVILTSDLYGDDVEYKGTIESLGIGTGSAFSLLPAQNASGNWIKIVQRLPVKIHLEEDNQAKYPLRIGLSMLAKVDIENTDGIVLAKNAPQQARLDTNVYQTSLEDADKLVKKILLDNVAVTLSKEE